MSNANPRCPTCRAQVSAVAKSFPFCSERCRLADLGNWLNERYVVPGAQEEDTRRDEGSDESTPAEPHVPRRLH